MTFTDLIFDLYGTLVDIHTDENAETWRKTALFFGYYGARYTGDELQAAFAAQMRSREAKAGQRYECFPDIPVEDVMAELFRLKGVTENVEALGFQAAQVFRVSATAYIRLYDGVPEALDTLRNAGFRLWLLSNAQRSFTAYELRLLGLNEQFDGVYLSSDYGCRKPDARFYHALLGEHALRPQSCLMIGNDRDTDITGAKSVGLATLYMHTNLTPDGQAAANPSCHPAKTQEIRHYEIEGADWNRLCELICCFRPSD